METKLISQKQIILAVNALKNEEVIAFPTETVFGLGVVFDSEKAYQKLVNVKKRPPMQPFTLMVADKEDIDKFAFIDGDTKKIIDKFMPGPLTLILRVKDNVPPFVTLGSGFIGIRISSLPLVRNLIRKVGKPLLVPSANKHGEAPGIEDQEVLAIFNGEIPVVIEGKSTSNVPSTIIKIDGGINLIREGAISLEQIYNVIEK